jgi:FtsP/CotA-like multicopper oxidase with cupredoxin domain
MSGRRSRLSRRQLLTGAGATAATLPALRALVPRQGVHDALASDAQASHGMAAHRGSGHRGAVGRVTPRANGFDPAAMVRDFDWGRTRREAGRTVREWDVVAEDKRIEVAPGVAFEAWTYNGRVPGPALRAHEGERLRINFTNGSSHPHTIHFHGIHTAAHDGVAGLGAGNVEPGRSFTYEFDAEPFGFHHYHCHTSPLAQHIAKGLYGAFIIDPEQGRPEADELILVQNAFDTNFDRENEVYAVNTVAFAYMHEPIRVKRDQLIRIYLLNMVEYDPVNSFHLHANFFHRFPTGTSLEPAELTDTVAQGQGQRDILELRFPYTGRYMFHAHVSEFAELGWMGFFEVVD